MILGISLNSRIISVVVLKDTALYDYEIRLFKERWCQDKMKRMLTYIFGHIAHHAIKQVSLLLPHNHHSNQETKLLIHRIKARCKQNQIAVCCFTARELYNLHEPSRQKKKALMQALSTLYPELSLAQKKELSNKKRYYFKLFEAVGATALYLRSLDY